MKKTLLSISFAMLSACQTPERNPSSQDVIEQRVFDQLKKTDAFEDLPPHLWSPKQRRASAGFYYLVAEYVGMQGDSMAAKELIAKAYDLDPNAFLGTKLVATEIQSGEEQKSLIDARKMVLLYPKSAILHLLYGEVLGRNRLFTEAIKETEEAIRLEPKAEGAYIQLLTLYRQHNKLPEAIATSQAMAQKFPGSIVAWSLLSRLHMINHDHPAALAAAEKAYQLQTTNDELQFIYAYTLELNAKRKHQAQAIYRQLFSKVPTPTELALRTGMMLRLWDKPEAAMGRLDELAATPLGQRPSLQIQRAYLLWELKRYDEAAVLLDQLVTANPDSPLMIYMAAQGHERLGHTALALVLYGRVESESDFFVLARYRMTEIYHRSGELDKALATILALIPHKYTTWESYIIAAKIYGDMQKYDEAIALLTRGSDAYPSKVKLLFLKGVFEERAGEREACIASMQAVISREPGYSSAYNYLGYLYAEQGERLDEAEALILKALSLKPNDGYYLDSLGWVYYMREDYDKALALFTEANKLAPQEGVILEHIGDVHNQQEQYKSAHEYYQKALACQLEEKDRQRITAKISELPAA